MNQQINLFQPIFRRQKKVFSATTMLQVSVLFIAIFAAIYGYGVMKLQPLREQLSAVNRANQDVKSRLDRLVAASSQSGSRLVENEIGRLSRELAEKRRVQELIASRALGNTTGMSGYLEAFARQHVNGIWITRLTIANGGRNLGLRGKTLQSGLVPVYIEKLGAESLLDGMAFNAMQVTRPVVTTGPYDFTISTH